ncbi:preprotein translocase subunit SecG [Marinicella sp. W31]|uniref:preprotein translocase subunit SecG n=1 Tax=Marinicella sp. W31 TaxID=3023713 RepID=UPI00375698CA
MTINFLNIIQVLVAIALIGFILIQRGPGATAGSAFGGGGGGGASGTVFGAKGSGSFLTKTTAILATLFFIITMVMAIEARNAGSAVNTDGDRDLGVMGTLTQEEQSDVPGVAAIPGDETPTVNVENQEAVSEEPQMSREDEPLQESTDQTPQAVDNPVEAAATDDQEKEEDPDTNN